jgi:cytochrome P450
VARLDQKQGSEAAGFYPPGPGVRPRDPSFFKALWLALRSTIEAWPNAVYERRVYVARLPGAPILLMDPELIRAVLVEQADDFPHGALFQRIIRPIWGRGLLMAEGAEWRWQRRAAAPPFRPAALAGLAPRIRALADASLIAWKSTPREEIDMAEEAARITLNVILDTMLSGGEDFDQAGARERIVSVVDSISRMRLSYFLFPDRYHRARPSPETTDLPELRAAVDRMIARRRSAPARGDLLDLLMAAIDPETGRAMDDETLRDNLLGFILAGYGTTAMALTWGLYLLSQHPPSLARLRAEIDSVTGGEPVGPEHLDRLVFTRQVINETLRLYPSAHSMTRVCSRATRIGDLTVRAGQRVIIPIYALHRHRLWWQDPERFDPDRFAPSEPPPNRHIYMPFGAGPRICIGAAFAMLELTVILATWVRAADFNLAPGHDVWPVATLGLQSRDGMPMRVAVRESESRVLQGAAG